MVAKKKIVKSNASNLSTEELQAELKTREEAEKKKLDAEKKAAAKAARAEAERIRKEKFGPLELAFEKAQQACEAELEEARIMFRKAESMAVEIAEKYGIPIEWDEGAYKPKSVTNWVTPDLDEDQLEFVEEYLNDMFYGDEETDPGQWWYPSRYC